MKFKIITTFCFLFFCNHIVFSDAIITLETGEVIVFKGNISCKKVTSANDKIDCEDNVVVLRNNGSWRSWIKKHYTPHHFYLKIKRGKIKVIDQEKTLYYKKWFLGKKIIIGNLEK